MQPSPTVHTLPAGRARLELVSPPVTTSRHQHDEHERIGVMATALAEAVDAKGRYYPSHSRAVGRLSQAVGARLGIRGDTLFRLGVAGLLHDVGKLQVPDSILLKPGKLTIAEYDAIKHHPLDGHRLLLSLGLSDEARWVLHHHERGDGSGYPSGLCGDAIPLGSRILLAADAYDCLTTSRVYRRAVTGRDALAEIEGNVGSQFDEHVVDALLAVTHNRSQL